MDLEKINSRQKALEISCENIAALLDIPMKEVEKFLSSGTASPKNIQKIMALLGLDVLGNEISDIQTLREKRAREKALYIVSLVQDTSSLEKQGLDEKDLQELLEETKEQFLTGEHKIDPLLWEK